MVKNSDNNNIIHLQISCDLTVSPYHKAQMWGDHSIRSRFTDPAGLMSAYIQLSTPANDLPLKSNVKTSTALSKISMSLMWTNYRNSAEHLSSCKIYLRFPFPPRRKDLKCRGEWQNITGDQCLFSLPVMAG